MEQMKCRTGFMAFSKTAESRKEDLPQWSAAKHKGRLAAALLQKTGAFKDYFLYFLRRYPPMPTSPVPKSSMETGSGIGWVVASAMLSASKA